MSEFMDRPRVAPEHRGAGTNGNGDVVHDKQSRGLADSSSGVGREESAAPVPAPSTTPSPSPEASPRAAGVSPAGGEPPNVRDRLGRFQVDNPGGPGNPFGRHVARMRQLLFVYFTEEKVLALFGKLETMALEGNIAAHNTLMKFLIGRPAPVVNPDRVNHEEWEMRREHPHGEEVAGHMQNQLHLGAVVRSQRIFDVAKQETYLGHIGRGAEESANKARKQIDREKRRAERKEERRRRRQG
jgi:hypothetical protein